MTALVLNFSHSYIILIVTSWLDNILGKKEDLEETKMTLKDIEDFIANKLKDSTLEESTKRICLEEYASLQPIVNNMQYQLKALEQASYSERTYPIIIRKAVGARKGFVDKMNTLIEQIKRPVGKDVSSVINFHEETTKIINVTNERTVREYSFLKELFKKEGREVVQSFRQLVEINSETENAVKGFRESKLQLLKARETAAEITNLTEALKAKEDAKLERELIETEDKSKKIENELRRLTESDEWKEFLKMQNTREEVKTAMEKNKHDFIQAVSKLETPLRKYNWSVKSKPLDNYIQHSFESILAEDSRGEIFMKAIKDMKSKLIKEEMELKDKDKFLSEIEAMIEEDTTGKSIGEYLKLLGELKGLEEKIATHEILRIKNNLENDINRLKIRTEEIRAEKKKTEERIKNMSEEKERKLKELEDLISSIADKKITLKAN